MAKTLAKRPSNILANILALIALSAACWLVVPTTGAMAATNPKQRVAVVTTDARMQALLQRIRDISAYPLRVFATLAEARRWVEER